MFSASSNPVLHSAHRFSGESFNLLPSSTVDAAVNYRQRKSFAITAAHTSTAPERDAATLSPSLGFKSATSFYEVLGISMEATNDEIKSAYRRLARIFHPDVAPSDRKSSSADDFMRIHAAYNTLSDPGERLNYDRQMFGMRRRTGLYSPKTATSSRFSGYAGRNWETDQCW